VRRSFPDRMSTESSSTPSRLRSYALFAVKLVVSVGLLALLFTRIDASRLWMSVRGASLSWLAFGLAINAATVLICVWRWHLLLVAQDVVVTRRLLLDSFLVALFFNNFLPSNIGGDVIRIRDTARPAGSKTLATTVVLIDRIIGLIGLVLVAALGATIAADGGGRTSLTWAVWLWAGFFVGTIASAPAVLAPAGLGRLLQPLTVFHPEWVGERIERITLVLSRLRDRPSILLNCFGGAVLVQAATVLFYLAVARSLHINIGLWDLAVVVPLSFIVQMLPVSVNGFGVREATFSISFARLGLPIESGLLLSLVAIALTILFSLVGGAVYVVRRR
jgi:glycosyltransferase 2 family protein